MYIIRILSSYFIPGYVANSFLLCIIQLYQNAQQIIGGITPIIDNRRKGQLVTEVNQLSDPAVWYCLFKISIVIY